MMENKTKIDLKNKSVFITGAAGFIGSNLAKRLLSTVEGVKVVGLDNMNHYYDVRLKEARLNELEQFENFSFVKGNLADKSVIEAIFEQYKPEIVVNLGAQAGVRYSITNPDASSWTRTTTASILTHGTRCPSPPTPAPATPPWSRCCTASPVRWTRNTATS